jgi:2-C-methyl-D-erythritol 4-phosphate cytidylyltransferase
MEGARVLVVGGTNGIGKAIAEEAERLGARTWVDGRSRGLDVRDAAAAATRIDAAAERLGGLDHVVVTAGVLRLGPLRGSSAQELAEVIDVNLTGTLNVALAAHPHLCASHGSLTVFASSSFTRGRPNYVAYSASKAGVVNMAQGLAEEWRDDGIRVNAISPERTDTPMRRRAFPEEPTDGMLTADEVALATIALLRSDLTGQVVDVKRHDGLGVVDVDAEPIVTSI